MSMKSNPPTSDSRYMMSDFYCWDDMDAEQDILTELADEPIDWQMPSPEEISRIGSMQPTSSHFQQYSVNQRPQNSRSNTDRSQNAPVQPAASHGQAPVIYPYASGTSSFPVQNGGLVFASTIGIGGTAGFGTGFGHHAATSQSEGPSESAVGGGHHANQQRNEGRRQAGRGSRRRERQGRESSFPGDGDAKQSQDFW